MPAGKRAAGLLPGQRIRARATLKPIERASNPGERDFFEARFRKGIRFAGSLEAGRVAFKEGDLRSDPLPTSHDLISFKSVLHDWPDDHAAEFLEKAVDALEPGGQIVIFERAPIELRGARLSYSMVANLVFLPFFRSPDLYLNRFKELGLVDINTDTTEMETRFFLVTARKPACHQRRSLRSPDTRAAARPR